MTCWQNAGYARDAGTMEWNEYCEHLRLGSPLAKAMERERR